MIKFINLSDESPYTLFKKKYDAAILANQIMVEAVAISSYSKYENEVDSRYVNLKIIDNKDFVFFTNYNSPKSIQFNSHNQISAIFFWNQINTQIRMKAKIKKISSKDSQEYFQSRSPSKNALAISSNQSKKIDSFDAVKINYLNTLHNEDLSSCPSYWGGFSFTPYYFEFWDGGENRINLRKSFICSDDKKWHQSILQP